MKKIFKTLFSLNPISITTGLILLVLVIFLAGVSLLDLLEWKAYDLRFLSKGVKKPSEEIVLAAIDEKSLDLVGRWPWPRNRIAELVDLISRDGAKVIALDLVLSEPEDSQVLSLIKDLNREIRSLGIRDPRLDAYIRRNGIKADNDLFLARSLEGSASKVILGYFFHMEQDDPDHPLPGKGLEESLRAIASSKYPLIKKTGLGALPEEIFLNAYAPESPLPILSRAADGTGCISVIPDPDGVIRWFPLVVKCGEGLYMPLSLQALWQYLDKPQLMVRINDYGIDGIQMGRTFIPTEESGQFLINYLGPPKTFPHYSAADILQKKFSKGTFTNKIVLVGSTAKGTFDTRNTPFGPGFTGLEIHATVMDNILKKDFLRKPRWAVTHDLLAIVILGLLTGLGLPRLSAIRGFLYAMGLFLVHILIGRWLFIHHGYWVNLVYPLLTVLLVYTSLTLFYYFTEERERKKVKNAFSYYVSGAVANEMLKTPGKLKLGGEKKNLSVLFSDIRGFTTISEGLSPEELVRLLNEYLTVMTDIVFKYEGTLDKYIGDAIMAVFGAPLDQADHAHRACTTALDMVQALKGLNEKWVEEGKRPLEIGIGINSGMMMVGNMGSEQRFDYTVMGDAVNLGSRLEGANKRYGTRILISEFTYERVRDDFTCMELDSVRVKGKQKPVRIYQLLGPMDMDESKKEVVALFHKGLDFYRQQRWDEARRIFQRIVEMDGELRAARIYVKRCLRLKAHPPGTDWDGVYVMSTK
ncbi:MAG: adenylate/guanylate cyclase domain-containing protein [Deltaproteobacteria bacterium]|nr:adenylate/guanylate cyclase domain-containing protein [Deltaproteobacteria bacterium]